MSKPVDPSRTNESPAHAPASSSNSSTKAATETGVSSADAADSRDDVEEQAPTPFDHPLFLPILLSGLMLWFGYDGWLNDDPDMAEHITFNRVGFGVLLVAAIYFGISGYKEWKDDQG